MASKENLYREELESQLEDSEKLKGTFLRLHKNYKRTFWDKWITGGVLFLFEIAFYLLFFGAALMMLVVLFDDAFLTAITHRLMFHGWLMPDELTSFVMILKATFVLLSLFLLSVGLILRGIRMRNRWLDEILAEIKKDIQLEDSREKRIKNIL